MTPTSVARDLTYATSARTRGGRAVIRALENATGRLGLIRRAAGYEHDVAAGEDFWQVMVERYGVRIEVIGGTFASIPADGPLVVVANHPYGILDGLVMGNLLSRTRAGEFRILANRVFKKARDLERVILPISFDDTKEAVAENVATRKECLRYLAEGGAIGVFPGGTVSTAPKPFARAMDPSWRSFTAKMIARSNATVVPIYFDGVNSRLFQIASHLHTTLRMALLIKEFRSRIDEPVRIVVGEPIDVARLAHYRHHPKAMMDFLRAETYALSPKPLKSLRYGFEFDGRYKA